jgi:predicted TIM-barrel fold metal-dependent hydrolase
MEFSPIAAAPLCAGPDAHAQKPAFTLPRGACDTHFHIFGPMAQYGFAKNRIYTPPDALLADWQRMAHTLGVERGVIVQPSVYGTDNSVTLANLQAMHGQWRAVVVVEDSITDKELEAMHTLGVRGIRFNVVDVASEKGVLPMHLVRGLAERIAPLGWHVQFLLHVDDYPDVTPLAHAIIEANPDRVVWGTDWPHPRHEGEMPNDGEMCNRLLQWIPDSAIRDKVLAVKPAKLYGF